MPIQSLNHSQQTIVIYKSRPINLTPHHECASFKEGTIEAALLLHHDSVEWNVTFIRDFNDWEVEEVISFMSLIYSNTPKGVGEDVGWWGLKSNGRFDIQPLYNGLRGSPRSAFPWRCIWRSKAPQRVCFFVWTAAWNKILTCDNLMRQGYALANWCCMCDCHGESVDHLLHCSMAGALWSFVFWSFGIDWVVSERVVDFLFGWHNSLGKFSSKIWNLVPLCLMWTVWRERNRCTFEDVSKNMQQLLDCFTAQLFDWALALGFTSHHSVLEFTASLHNSTIIDTL